MSRPGDDDLLESLRGLTCATSTRPPTVSPTDGWAQPRNRFRRSSRSCSCRGPPGRSGATAALPRTAVASVSAAQVSYWSVQQTRVPQAQSRAGGSVEAHSRNAHKARSEEATARCRERRKDVERMKLKRAAKLSESKSTSLSRRHLRGISYQDT